MERMAMRVDGLHVSFYKVRKRLVRMVGLEITHAAVSADAHSSTVIFPTFFVDLLIRLFVSLISL